MFGVPSVSNSCAFYTAHEAAGAVSIRHSLRPLDLRGHRLLHQSGIPCRGKARARPRAKKFLQAMYPPAFGRKPIMVRRPLVRLRCGRSRQPEAGAPRVRSQDVIRVCTEPFQTQATLPPNQALVYESFATGMRRRSGSELSVRMLIWEAQCDI
jgi:hypothetical protein